MAYTTGTFGVSPNVYGYKAPTTTELIYCYSPYYIEITGTTSNQKVTLTVNSQSLVRYTGVDEKCKFPLSSLFSSFFYGVDFGDVDVAETGVYENAASKLFQNDKNVVVLIGTDTDHTLTLTYDIVFGALQTGEVFEDETTIFAFRAGTETLPLTITELVGDDAGVDFWVSDKIDDDDATNDIVLIKTTLTPITETLLEVGDVDANGIKTFYVLKEGDFGYDEDIHKVLQFKEFTSDIWYNNLTEFTSGTSQLLGYGLANTQLIVDNLTAPEYSQAYKLLNKDFGGYTDWYMGSANELVEILKNDGYLDPTAFYYSSSDYSMSQAYAVTGYPETPLISAIDKDSSQPMIGIRTNLQPLFTETVETVKTYTVKELPYCAGGHYLRWLDPKAEYKYFYFTPGIIKDELKDGVNIQQNVWGTDDLKSDIVLKDKSGNETYECGVLAANYQQQLHLIGLQRSIKQWVWENDVWVECRVQMPPIVINRFRSPIEVNITIIKPSLYMQSL